VKRLLLLPLALLALPAAPAAAAPSVSTKVLECESSLDQPARTMVVEGRMRTVPGARRLQMRFSLQTRLPGRTRWIRVAVPGFTDWSTADPAPRRYVFDKRIEGLAAPAQYRMIVRFRWLGAGDDVLASARRTSASCAQADLRPDLEAERIGVAAGEQPGTSRYVVPVRNDGPSVAAPFALGLTVDGVALRPVSVVTGLAPGARSELTFDGPRCRAGSTLVAHVDPDGEVDERDESDNVLSRACPA